MCVIAGTATAQDNPYLDLFGTPGLLDMPSGRSLPDGAVALTFGVANATSRNALTFQISERLSGTFRYSTVKDFDLGTTGRDRFDRSFDLTFQVTTEGVYRPAIAIGLRDFGGTGLYSSEFIAATKSFGNQVQVTAGIGWGRLARRNAFDNPLSSLSDYFAERPNAATGGISTTGQLDFDNWFRGDAAIFGGVEWFPNDKMRFVLEYSTDSYTAETARGLIDQQTPLNIGASYRFDNGIDLGLNYLYGTDLSLMLSYTINPRRPASVGGIESGMRSLLPRRAVGSGDDLAGAMRDVGLVLVDSERRDDVVTVRINNARYRNGAQAIGRAARTLANAVPDDVEILRIVPMQGGMPLSAVTLRRSDLELLENDLDASWQSYVRADISDAFGLRGAQPADRFTYRITPYLSPSLFDPDNPLRADVGVQLFGEYVFGSGVSVAGALRQPVFGNLDEATRRSDSVLPHVRSDFAIYDAESTLELSFLTAEYLSRPGPNLYSRVTFGYLEPMFAGVSGELLWKPVEGPLALGAEINYVVQRDFDLGFGLQDYDVVTGHLSGYYDFGGGYRAQLDLGRYLAGDWGGTLSFNRQFENGFTVGAFATLTDVSFEDFGEGSFDKGVVVTVPVDWLSGRATQDRFTTTIRPVLRDGGARLDVRNRLYGVVQGYHDPALADGWGRFWR